MNRPGAMPQTIRGMPGGFGGQQQPQQPNRSVSSRLPNGKMANNNSASWAFGGGVPMGGAGLPNPNSRQMGGNVSFAQSLSGSQPGTPLDLSEFPSLSNNAQMPSANQTSMWSNASATGGSRNISAPVQRNQSTPLSSQAGQEDPFSPQSSRLPPQHSGFRFGNQGGVPTTSQQSTQGAVDDFPPLNRNGTADLGSDRMGSMGFSAQAGTASASAQSNRGNGLLNALSANSRASEARSPPGIGVPGSATGQTEDGVGKTSSPAGGPNEDLDGSTSKLQEDKQSQAPEEVDLLSGMPEADKWGVKGLRTLMNNYGDYHAMIIGLDPQSLGLDVNSPEPFSSQVLSVFDESPPRPTVSGSRFRLPDCYNVTNVQPIETKIQSFNEETLFWIFYSCPFDIKQQMAAVELHSRNWRWHKKHQIWLTKDEQMTPQILSPVHERGYYIVWDTSTWRKDRREFTLYYNDLDTTMNQAPVVA